MQTKSSPQPKPVVTYPALVGKVLAHRRKTLNIEQGKVAADLGLSQSAYSRLESGESVLNVSQLHNVAGQLGMRPAQVLSLADRYAAQLEQQGVNIIAEKQNNSAAIAIGLGLLAALLMGGK